MWHSCEGMEFYLEFSVGWCGVQVTMGKVICVGVKANTKACVSFCTQKPEIHSSLFNNSHTQENNWLVLCCVEQWNHRWEEAGQLNPCFLSVLPASLRGRWREPRGLVRSWRCGRPDRRRPERPRSRRRERRNLRWARRRARRSCPGARWRRRPRARRPARRWGRTDPRPRRSRSWTTSRRWSSSGWRRFRWGRGRSTWRGHPGRQRYRCGKPGTQPQGQRSSLLQWEVKMRSVWRNYLFAIVSFEVFHKLLIHKVFLSVDFT